MILTVIYKDGSVEVLSEVSAVHYGARFTVEGDRVVYVSGKCNSDVLELNDIQEMSISADSGNNVVVYSADKK